MPTLPVDDTLILSHRLFVPPALEGPRVRNTTSPATSPETWLTFTAAIFAASKEALFDTRDENAMDEKLLAVKSLL